MPRASAQACATVLLAFKRHRGATRPSRRGREFTDRFPGIRDAVLTLPCRSAIIDGEVVVCNEDGTLNFRRLHLRRYADQTLCVWAFDVMELNGADLRALPLSVRKQKLGTLLRRHDNPCVRYSEPFKVASSSLLNADRGLEGIVSKRKQAPYRSGKCDWVKVKCAQWKEDNKDRGDLFMRWANGQVGTRAASENWRSSDPAEASKNPVEVAESNPIQTWHDGRGYFG